MWGWCSARLRLGALPSFGEALAAAERFVRGYRREHVYLGVQLGVAFVIALLPVFIDSLYSTLDRAG